jgi:hypothetical protein
MDSQGALRHHHRRPSLLSDNHRDSSEESSTSSTSSPGRVQSSRTSADPPDLQQLGKCQCSRVKPSDNLEQRYGREPLR